MINLRHNTRHFCLVWRLKALVYYVLWQDCNHCIEEALFVYNDLKKDICSRDFELTLDYLTAYMSLYQDGEENTINMPVTNTHHHCSYCTYGQGHRSTEPQVIPNGHKPPIHAAMTASAASAIHVKPQAIALKEDIVTKTDTKKFYSFTAITAT
eukprot:301095_1